MKLPPYSCSCAAIPKNLVVTLTDNALNSASSHATASANCSAGIDTWQSCSNPMLSNADFTAKWIPRS
jgi:hypothetical protein